MRLFTVVSNSFISAGGGGDATPNPTPNWVGGIYESSTNIQQIQGITQTITLRISWLSNEIESLYVYVNSTQQGQNYSDVFNGATFTVNPDYYVSFQVGQNYGFNTAYVDVTNVSDNDALLDTFEVGIVQPP